MVVVPFLFVRVLPFLCKERESVSMSAPKAQTSRFERDKKRERERDDDDVVWVTLLCFCTHEKTRDPKRSPKREDEEKRSFFSPIYYVRAYKRVG